MEHIRTNKVFAVGTDQVLDPRYCRRGGHFDFFPLIISHRSKLAASSSPFFAGFLPHASEAYLLHLHSGVRKLSHVAEFAVFSVYRISRSSRAASRLAAEVGATDVSDCVSYAVLDEFHQTHVPLRHASPADIGIDTLGAALAQLVVGGMQTECGRSRGFEKSQNSRRARTASRSRVAKSRCDYGMTAETSFEIDAFGSACVHGGCDIVVGLPALHARVCVAHSTYLAKRSSLRRNSFHRAAVDVVTRNRSCARTPIESDRMLRAWCNSGTAERYARVDALSVAQDCGACAGRAGHGRRKLNADQVL